MKNRLPSLNGLRAFEAAARHLSFTKAADELHVTQTAISHQIRRLEEELGLNLFTRRHRGLQLTGQGEQLAVTARQAFDDLRRATQRLRQSEDDNRITITTLPSLAAKWLIPKLGAFQDRHPEIEVRVNTSTESLDLRERGIDVALRYGYGAWAGMISKFLMTESLTPVCSPKLLAEGPSLKTPADLARHTLLYVASYRDEWQTWLTAAGAPDVKAARTITFDMSMMALQAAMDGMGVALGREPMVDADLKAGRLVAPMNISLRSDAGYYVVMAPESAERPAVQAFRDWVLELAGPNRRLDALAAGD